MAAAEKYNSFINLQYGITNPNIGINDSAYFKASEKNNKSIL